MSQGSVWGEQIVPWGVTERTPLGKVVGNLAQAKTGSTLAHRTPFALKMFCNEFDPLCFHRCDSLKKILLVK